MTKQILILTKINTFIWETTLARAKIVYSAVIRPAIIYEFIVWQTHKENSNVITLTTQKTLNRIQNKYLRIIAEAYKIILIFEFKKKTNLSFIIMYLN